MNILIVEDELSISGFVELNLVRAGHTVTAVTTGEAALASLKDGVPCDIMLLDIMLPGIDGFEVCRRIRRDGGSMGIIMLSAKSKEADRVTGLSAGADDYIPKPFSMIELNARIESLARRLNRSFEKKSAPGALYSIDEDSRTAVVDGKTVTLTPVELALFKALIHSNGQILSRETLFRTVWSDIAEGKSDTPAEMKVVDVTIRRLRMKIEADSYDPKHILVVRGSGYKWQN